MSNIKLVLEYDGSGFHGWQRQRDLRTVQGELEDKLRMILGEDVRLTGAGRTDAGSHASCQVANFKTAGDPPPDGIKRALNGIMRGEVVVKDAGRVPEDFNARFSAASRRYRYLIAERPVALMRDRAWVVGRSLDLEAMSEGSRALVGRHDFSKFSKKSERTDRNPLCAVRTAAWDKWDLGLSFEIEADRFMHGMVRMIVGTVERVGAGRAPVECVAGILDGAPEHRVGPAAPAKGLYLVGVDYDAVRTAAAKPARSADSQADPERKG